MPISKLKETAFLITGIGLVLTNRMLLRMGLCRRVDGWRRGTGLLLRGENATFVLSAFSLDLWSDAQKPSPLTSDASRTHFADRLARFLATEPGCHVCVVRSPSEDRAEPCAQPSYSLAFQDWIDGPARFIRPDDWAGVDGPTPRAASTDVLLNIVCRINPTGCADVWMRVNHIGADGVPMQETLTRLESIWGFCDKTIYPTPEAFASYRGPRRCAGRTGFIEVQAFLDFSPLLAWRKKMNATLPEPLTVSAAMLWCLSRHEAFSAIRMGTTVEVGAVGDLGRGVGVYVVRPGDYQNRTDGLAQYVQDFNRGLDLNRRRESEGCKTLDAAALMPANVATVLIRHALNGDRAFGSLALTVLKDAKVFGAPLGDAGHSDGFIALGSVDLDAGDGRKVGCITIKGLAENIAAYPALIEEAISRRLETE